MLLLVVLAIVSCRTRNDINYLQDVDKAATETALRMENNTLQPASISDKYYGKRFGCCKAI